MKISLIVLAALCATALLRDRSAALRHWVLAAAMACAAILPLMESFVPTWSVPFGGAAPWQSADGRPLPPLQVEAGAAVPYQHVLTTSSALRESTGKRVTSTARRQSTMSAIRGWLGRLWTAGFALATALLLVGLGRLWWLASRSKVVSSGMWKELMDELSARCELRRPVTLLQSDHPALLVTWGVRAPKVILPASAAGWPETRARVVLSHELAHIKRGDWIVQMTAELLRAWYWFNPLIWIACRRLRLESDQACDDDVMKSGIDGTAYATQLLDLAHSLNIKRYRWLPAPAMARQSSLERRVRAMLNHRLNRSPLTRRGRIGVLIGLLGMTAGIAAAQGAFVSFSGSVLDQHGGGIADATLVLSEPQRQAKYEVKSNEAGAFEFVGLPSGDYGLEVRARGFRPGRTALSVAGQNLHSNITLEIGSIVETVMIVEGGPNTRGHSSPAVRELKEAVMRACTPSQTGGQIVPPRKIRDVSPEYPASLVGTGMHGTVILAGTIGTDGVVRNISVLREVHPDLANAAVAALSEWRFTETLLNCAPVEVQMTATMGFAPAPPPPPPAPPKP